MWSSNPTPTLTGEWLMTMVNDILQQMPGLGQPQRKFLATLFITILVLRGRVNFRNLSRYCDYAERTIARQFREPFDWPDLHQRVLMTALDPRSELVSAHDASFIPKSGKQTFGLGHFFNGCASRAERGLEISTLAVVDVTRRCALTLAVSQTPPGEEPMPSEPEETRVDFYTQQLRAHRHRLPSAVIYHCVDGYYAKKKYIDEVVRLNLHAITRLRSDADCLFLYTGPHPKRRGARRKYAGKVNFQSCGHFGALGTRADEPHLHLYTAVVWHKTLKRRLRLVVLLNRKDPAKPRFIVLGSTDPELNGHKQEHSVILTTQRDSFYNRGKLNNHPIGKDSRWAVQRLSRYPRCAQAPSGSGCATHSTLALTSGSIGWRSSCPIPKRAWPR